MSVCSSHCVASSVALLAECLPALHATHAADHATNNNQHLCPLLRLTADPTCPARRRSLLDAAAAKHWNRNPFRHFKWVLQLQSGRCSYHVCAASAPYAACSAPTVAVAPTSRLWPACLNVSPPYSALLSLICVPATFALPQDAGRDPHPP